MIKNVAQKPEAVDIYIAQLSGLARRRFEDVFAYTASLLPDASIKISYGVPTFYNERGFIVYVAGYEKFVSIYPVHLAKGISDDIQPYLSGKATARFMHDKPLPKPIIKKIVTQLLKVNQERKK